MRLKKLELYGFKSFAQRTEIVLNEGITGIVGPNGSGKSNIADAVRWVLGEQSAKSLRGASMSDVIFGGTQRRKPLSYCEVSLIFDNEDHTLPLDYAEVMVTRRVYRTGESEYVLNGSACRLKDIVDLFRDTGIGREGYSIVGQGRIDEILSRRSEDRRAVFEEAAGINKFRARKEEADRKLERAQANAERIDDLLEELDRRLGPLEEQAEAARTYLELSGELKVLDMNLFLHRSDRFTARLAELDVQLMAVQAALAESEQRIAEKTAQRDEVQTRIAALEERVTAARDALLQCTERVHEAQSALSETASRAAARAENRERLRAETEENAARRAELEETLRATDDEAQGELLRQAEEDLARTQESAAAAEAEEAEAGETLEQHKNAVLEAINRMSTLRNSQTRLSTMRGQMAQRMEEVSGGIAALRAQEDELAQAAAGAEALLEEERGRRAELEEAYRAEQESLARADAALLEKRQAAEALSAELQAAAERRRVLAEMTREMEGYSQSVRRAMQAARQRGMAGVHGVLAQLMTVPEKYETAVDMVLGATLQHIVTDDEDTAKELIRYLRENRLGRATFLPITSVRSKTLDNRERRALDMPGCLGVASDLVQCDEKYRGIIENLLGRTVVAENLERGIPIMQAFGHSFRLVTLEGDVMHSGGSMTGGSVQSRMTNLLGRERELKELTRRLDLGRGELDEAKRGIAEGQRLKDARKQAVADALEALHQQEIAVARESERSGNAAAELEAHRDRIREREDAVEQLQTAIAEIDTQLEAVNEDTGSGEVDRAAMEERTAQLQQALNAARARSAELKEELLRATLHASEMRHLEENRRTEKRRLESDLARLGAEQARREAELAALEEKEQEDAALRARQEAECELRKLEQTRQEQAARALEEERAGRQEALRELLTDIERLHQASGRDSDKAHRLELSRAKVDGDLHALQARMWDSYEITYAGAEEYRMAEGFNATEADRRAAELQTRIRALGPVNPHAVEEYADTRARYDELKAQQEDLRKAEEDLRQLIERLLAQMQTTFVANFTKLQGYFTETFSRLFGGGHAELLLTDAKDPLNCGIEVNAQPPGKKLQLLSLLSGGERALTAIAILFAMLKLRPSPFCILDEIEAALDDANIGYYADYLREYSRGTQFIVITHRKGTMERCNELYGVAMEEQGVSKMVSVSLQDYQE